MCLVLVSQYAEFATRHNRAKSSRLSFSHSFLQFLSHTVISTKNLIQKNIQITPDWLMTEMRIIGQLLLDPKFGQSYSKTRIEPEQDPTHTEGCFAALYT